MENVGKQLCKPIVRVETIIPRPWLASLEYQKAHLLSKGNFPMEFHSFLTPTHSDTRAVHNNLLLFSPSPSLFFFPLGEGRIFSPSARINEPRYLYI